MVTCRQNSAMNFSVLLALVTIVAGGLLAWQTTQVGDFTSLWLTPDQQARRAYEALEFRVAWERFEDPAWKGIAAYDSGLYEESASAFGRVPTAEGFYNRGNAFMKAGSYGKAIVAFEQAVAEAPDWVEAQENLSLATYTLEYIERVREQAHRAMKQKRYGAAAALWRPYQGVIFDVTISRTSRFTSQPFSRKSLASQSNKSRC